MVVPWYGPFRTTFSPAPSRHNLPFLLELTGVRSDKYSSGNLCTLAQLGEDSSTTVRGCCAIFFLAAWLCFRGRTQCWFSFCCPVAMEQEQRYTYVLLCTERSVLFCSVLCKACACCCVRTHHPSICMCGQQHYKPQQATQRQREHGLQLVVLVGCSAAASAEDAQTHYRSEQ